MPTLIDRDQTGYVKNRFIGENIGLISDVIELYEKKNLPGMLLFIDFEKAFDSLEWNYLFKVLEVMNFGPMFRKWIHTFYSQAVLCASQFQNRPSPPPPGQTPGHLTFWNNFGQIPRYIASLDGQMPRRLGLQRASNPPPSRHVEATVQKNFHV